MKIMDCSLVKSYHLKTAKNDYTLSIDSGDKQIMIFI